MKRKKYFVFLNMKLFYYKIINKSANEKPQVAKQRRVHFSERYSKHDHNKIRINRMRHVNAATFTIYMQI